METDNKINMRIADDIISTLKPHQVFVFGSNRSGIHGAGAAKLAYERFGAVMGKGEGLHGQSYALPTKGIKVGDSMETLLLQQIEHHVDAFIQVAYNNPDLEFHVTQVGCGLSGYSHHDVAPMFKECLQMENVYLPQAFILAIEEDIHGKNN